MSDFNINAKDIDVNNIVNNIKNKIVTFFQNLNDKNITVIWISCITICAFLFFGITTNARIQTMINKVNKIMLLENNDFFLHEGIKTFGIPGHASQLGKWFVVKNINNLNTQNIQTDNFIGVFFPVMSNGLFTSCLAVVDNNNNIISIIPIGNESHNICSKLTEKYKSIFLSRIENAARAVNASRGIETRR